MVGFTLWRQAKAKAWQILVYNRITKFGGCIKRAAGYLGHCSYASDQNGL